MEVNEPVAQGVQIKSIVEEFEYCEERIVAKSSAQLMFSSVTSLWCGFTSTEVTFPLLPGPNCQPYSRISTPTYQLPEYPLLL
jgi:hypothetical protein